MTTRFIRSSAIVGLVASLGFGLAACSSDDSSSDTTEPGAAGIEPAATDPAGTEAPSGTAAPAPAGDAALVIADFAFSPATVSAGTEFTISNKDGFAHTVTGDTFDVSVSGDGTATLTIDEAGSYPIHCKIHPQMQGTITVE